MKQKLLLGLAGAAAAIFVSSLFPDFLRQLEWKTVDLRFEVRGPVPMDRNLVLIDADDASAAVYGPWPWKRTAHADMIAFLQDAGAKTAVYDVLFARPGDAADDARLVEAAGKAGNVVFPVAVRAGEPPLEPRAGTPSANGLDSQAIADSPQAKNFPSVTEAVPPFAGFADANVATGHIAANRDADGVVRRVPLLLRRDGKLLPALGLRAVMRYLDIPSANVEVRGSAVVLKGVRLPDGAETADISIPVDSRGQMLINFAGRWEDTFKHASFASVLSQRELPNAEGEDLAGKLVLVSNTQSGQDIKPTPVEKDYPGSGIHANIVNTILTRNFLRETHESSNHAIVLLLCLATSIILGGGNYPLRSAGALLLAGGYAGCAVWAFRAGWVVPVFLPILSAALTAILVSVYRAHLEQGVSGVLLEEKRRVEEHLQSISSHLGRKEDELVKIQTELASLNRSMEMGRDEGKVQAEKIDDLQRKLQSLTADREKLQAERAELENKVLDLRVHISFEPPADEDLAPLREECARHGIVTRNEAALEVFRILKQAARVPTSVLILGESGTGKELFARALHALSGRTGGFVAVNMGAIPDGLVESELFGHAKGAFTGALRASPGKFVLAGKGSLFLDEIGEIKNDIQVKLLRALQDKEVQPVGGTPARVDARIIAATNKELEREIQAGRFREDLFYRLNTITLRLPPLRNRREDIETLTRHFIDKYRVEYGKKIEGISDKAMKRLLAHDWPGNIRELENVVQRGITLAESELVQEKDLGLLDKAVPADETPEERAKPLNAGDDLLLRALRENAFEINAAAARLNMSRNTVASRFKGICFDVLVKNGMDREKVAETLSPDPACRKAVLRKIAEYHDNLIGIAREFGAEEGAVKEALRRSKNVPLQYHPAIEELVRGSFASRTDAREGT